MMTLPYQIALQLYNEKEIVGRSHNPRIVKLFTDLGFNGRRLGDETAWCAALVNWCLLKSGHEHTGKLNATSFLDWGEEVHVPQLGDLVVFWRGDVKGELIPGTNIQKGHVGFFMREHWGWVQTLGGNQNNSLNITGFRQSLVRSYRRHKDWPKLPELL